MWTGNKIYCTCDHAWTWITRAGHVWPCTGANHEGGGTCDRAWTWITRAGARVTRYAWTQKSRGRGNVWPGFELTGRWGFNPPPSSPVHSIVTPNPLVHAVLLTLPVHFSQFEPCVWQCTGTNHEDKGIRVTMHAWAQKSRGREHVWPCTGTHHRDEGARVTMHGTCIILRVLYKEEARHLYIESFNCILLHFRYSTDEPTGRSVGWAADQLLNQLIDPSVDQLLYQPDDPSVSKWLSK